MAAASPANAIAIILFIPTLLVSTTPSSALNAAGLGLGRRGEHTQHRRERGKHQDEHVEPILAVRHDRSPSEIVVARRALARPSNPSPE